MMKQVRSPDLSLGQKSRMMPDSLGYGHPYTLPEIERAHELIARIIVRSGTVYLPLLDRMEREVTQARRQVEGPARAQAVLDGYAKRRRGEAAAS
ncbi:hypothetical protein [Methylobacterium sp. WL6]|uniref:hypothetical protein n=1 Tax=Methylobacterium sp. WL6 TaxID=2603901 RepID=UPI0011C8DF70|nr:hypothetical protein [Methylobacterium sp. WL6]TXN73443.1 hypothetical protein FV230_01345 [Methylobacterium sp. WL6]